MKIVCDSCGAKYSIADAKVAGKVFRIRCKRCGAPIIVRGDEMSTTDHAAGGAEPNVDEQAIWHVVVQGEQKGPLSSEQVQQMHHGGQLGWEDYIWREGFDGWKPLRDAEELKSLLAAPHTAENPAPPPEVAGHGGSTGGLASAAGPSSQLDSGKAAVANRTSHHGLGADLFATTSTASGAFSPMESHSSRTASVAASEHQPMTGQRNENSVLFSLSNLQALATGGHNGRQSAPPDNSNSNSKGEGSGLIDIRALASATSAQHGTSGKETANVDALLSLGGGGGLTAPLLAGAPVEAEEEKKPRSPMMIMVVAAIVTAVAAVAALVVVLSRQNDSAASTNNSATDTAAATVASKDTPASNDSDASPKTADDAPQANAVGDASPKTADDTLDAAATSATEKRRSQRSARQSSRHSGQRRRSKPESSRNDSAAAASKTAPPNKNKGGKRDIDSLLESALGSGGRKGRSAAPAANANLPEVPPRSAVLSALRAVQGAVKACGNGQHGVANTAISVAGNTGRVQSVRVSGPFAGTPVAACVSRAVRGARFPKFKRPTFKIASFPYAI